MECADESSVRVRMEGTGRLVRLLRGSIVGIGGRIVLLNGLGGSGI